jgi:TPR repeat protein
LIAIEDDQGRCAKAVTLMLDDYLRMRATAGSESNQRYLKVLPSPKPLPKSARLFSIGEGDEPTYLALATHRGALWLARSTDLPYLERTLTDLLSPGPVRQSLKSRRELATLTTTGALASGFWREDEISLSDLLDARQSRPGARSPMRDDRQVRRVPFSVVRAGRSLSVGVQVDVVAVRRVVARLLGEAIRGRDLAPLPAEQRDAALRVLDAACLLDDAASCNIAGVIYGEGRGVPKDLERAVSLLDRACRLQNGFGCANLTFYQKLAAADELKLFQKSCDLGTPFGCAWLGARMLEQDNADKRLAMSKLQLGCDGYVGFACARIGSHYWNGMGLPKDEEKAADFFERACLLRNGVGCVELASALQLGKGRQRDEVLALTMLKDGCKLDKADGCFALGTAYLRGVGTPKDVNLAKQHLGTACDANHAEACRWLAELSEEP